MVKVRLLSRHMTGWIAEFSGDEVKKIREYCLKEDEEIRYFFGGPNEEELVQEEVNENFDMYSYYGSSSPMEYSYPILEDCEIIIEQNGKEKNISIDDVTIQEDKISVEEWKENNKGKDTIAYSFGYKSDEILEMEFEFDVEEFDASKLTLSVEYNEFFPNKYIIDLQYDDMDGDWEDVDDFEGEYYDTEYFESK